MYIIVGLGNFGKEYVNTRHNIGFDVIDKLAEQENISPTRITVLSPILCQPQRGLQAVCLWAQCFSVKN